MLTFARKGAGSFSMRLHLCNGISVPANVIDRSFRGHRTEGEIGQTNRGI